MSLPFVEVLSTVNYFPIAAYYDEADRSDEDYTAMLVDVDVAREWWLIPFIFNVGAGFSWMNSDYAEANYSVKYATDRLDVFKAASGIHDVHVSANIIMMFSERAGTALIAEGAYHMGDAADSPLTENEFQPSLGLFLFYRFFTLKRLLQAE